jgi:hypothetical protein
MAINPYELRLPKGVEDLECELRSVALELAWASRALKEADSALTSCEWGDVPSKLENLREALTDALAVLDTLEPEAQAIADRTSGDW